MTGRHIRKRGKDDWEYPDHGVLFRKCKLFPIETYLERRRGTLRKYLVENREELLESTEGVKNHSRDSKKVLWWTQKWIDKKELERREYLWFRD